MSYAPIVFEIYRVVKKGDKRHFVGFRDIYWRIGAFIQAKCRNILDWWFPIEGSITEPVIRKKMNIDGAWENAIDVPKCVGIYISTNDGAIQ